MQIKATADSLRQFMTTRYPDVDDGLEHPMTAVGIVLQIERRTEHTRIGSFRLPGCPENECLSRRERVSSPYFSAYNCS